MAEHERLHFSVTQLMLAGQERRMFVGPGLARRWIVERLTVNSDVSPQYCDIYKNVVGPQTMLHQISEATHRTLETRISLETGERLIAIWNQPGNCTLILEGDNVLRTYGRDE